MILIINRGLDFEDLKRGRQITLLAPETPQPAAGLMQGSFQGPAEPVARSQHVLPLRAKGRGKALRKT